MTDTVLVKSKTINEESVPVIIKVVEVGRGEIKEEREISRSYIFKDFETEMPLEHAKSLIKQNPNEFKIIEAKEEIDKETEEEIEKIKKRQEGFECPKCGKANIKSKAGLVSHIRCNHPDLFKDMYPPKEKKQ